MKTKVLWIFLFCWGTRTYCPCLAGDMTFSSNLEVGEGCRSEGVEGECRLIKDCVYAQKQLANNPSHQLKICGYKGFQQVVCCPTPVTGCCPNRAAVEACKKINRPRKELTRHVIEGMLAEEGEFPHMAILGFPQDEGLSWECGATIISDQFLLTAAHCFKRFTPIVARLGVIRLNDTNHQDYEIEDVISHESYNFENKHNDIALIKLKKKITITTLTTPACLYTEKDDPDRMIVTGWGKTKIESSKMSNELQKALLKPQTRIECNDAYYNRTFGTKTVVGTQLCAVGVNGKSDACQGDSGGPLQIIDPTEETDKYYVVGVTSYGASCGGSIAGIYTRVSSYLDWIEQKVWS